MAETDKEQILSDQDIRRVLGRKPRWVAPALIIVGGFAALILFYFAGGSLVKQFQTPTPMLAPPEPKPTPEGLAEILADTIDIEDFKAEASIDSSDTLNLMIQKALTTPVDTLRYVELPGTPFDSLYGMMTAIVMDDDLFAASDSSLDEILATPIKSAVGELPSMPWQKPTGEPEATAPTLDSASVARAHLLGREEAKSELDARQALIDSLRGELFGAERELVQVTGERNSLGAKFERLSGAIDSARSAQVKKFSKILESTKAPVAAQMLEKLEPADRLEIILKLKPRTASQILEYLPSDIAGELAARVVRR